MEQKFNKFAIANLKRTAASVDKLVSKKNKLMEQVYAIKAELDQLTPLIEEYQAPIRRQFEGYSTEDLIVKTVETTNSVDAKGNPVKITKYNLRYPDTIIPPICNEEISIDANGCAPEMCNQNVPEHTSEDIPESVIEDESINPFEL